MSRFLKTATSTVGHLAIANVINRIITLKFSQENCTNILIGHHLWLHLAKTNDDDMFRKDKK